MIKGKIFWCIGSLHSNKKSRGFCTIFDVGMKKKWVKFLKFISLLTDIEALIDEHSDLTDEEKAFLKKLTEEPTSLSADLIPKPNSFVSNYVPESVDVNQAR